MPFVRSSSARSEIDQKLKTKRQKIIEEERIRVLGDSLILFYDKLMEKYVLINPQDDEVEGDVQLVVREEVEQLAREYAATKPLGF